MGRQGSPPEVGAPPADGALAVGIEVRVAVGGGDAVGTHSPGHVGGRAGTILSVVAGGNPLELAGGEVGAGGKGETHGVSVELRIL